MPLYPNCCKEEVETSEDDDEDVGKKPNLIIIPEDEQNTELFTTAFLPASPPHCSQEQESRPGGSDQEPVSHSSLLPDNQPSNTQLSSPSFETAQITASEFPSPQAHASSTCQQPLILPDNISLTAATYPSPTAAIQLPEMKLYPPQEQQLTASSAHEPSPIGESIQAPLSPIEPASHTWLPSFQHFLSPRPKPAFSSAAPPTSSSSVPPPQFPFTQQNCGSPTQQTTSKCHSNQSGNKSNIFAFNPLRSPPVLSSPSARFKRFQRTTCQLPPSPKPPMLLSPKQGQFKSAPTASLYPSVPYSSPQINSLGIDSPISPLKLNISARTNIAPSSHSPASAPELKSSTEKTSFSFFSLNSPTAPSPHSFLRLKPSALTPPDSNFQINSTSELPMSSLQLISSSQESGIFVAEPPSIQSPRINNQLTNEMKYDSSESNSQILDALLQEAQAEASLSNLEILVI